MQVEDTGRQTEVPAEGKALAERKLKKQERQRRLPARAPARAEA